VARGATESRAAAWHETESSTTAVNLRAGRPDPGRGVHRERRPRRHARGGALGRGSAQMESASASLPIARWPLKGQRSCATPRESRPAQPLPRAESADRQRAACPGRLPARQPPTAVRQLPARAGLG
jgi:hypothetical protein